MVRGARVGHESTTSRNGPLPLGNPFWAAAGISFAIQAVLLLWNWSNYSGPSSESTPDLLLLAPIGAFYPVAFPNANFGTFLLSMVVLCFVGGLVLHARPATNSEVQRVENFLKLLLLASLAILVCPHPFTSLVPLGIIGLMVILSYLIAVPFAKVKRAGSVKAALTSIGFGAALIIFLLIVSVAMIGMFYGAVGNPPPPRS